MRHILKELITRLEKGESVVIGGIIRASGSVPRTSGARMLVTEDGTLYGSVGGGLVEGSCHSKAKQLLDTEKSYELVEFNMQPSDAADAGMVCGGAVTILLQRLDASDLEMFKKLQQGYAKSEKPVLLTFLTDPAPRMTLLHDDPDGLIDKDLKTALTRKSRREPFHTKSGQTEILAEPIIHPGVVHLVGAGHVAQATAHLAAHAGFDIVVMDDREEFANKERYPDAREIKVLDNFDTCVTDMGPDDYVIIVTRGHMYDRDVLAQALNTDAGYIGMIGSKKKRQAVYDSLLASGYSNEQLERVYSPIGLSIGADTPEEIGFSIVAELIQVRAGK